MMPTIPPAPDKKTEALLDTIEWLRKQLNVATGALDELEEYNDFKVHIIARRAKDRIHIIQRSKSTTGK